MLRFAVCDDERAFCDYLKGKIYDYSNLHKLDLAVDIYLSGYELLRSDNKYAVVFMDYIMDGLDGLQTARKLREKDDDCTIIFTTMSLDAGPESMEIGSFRYLVKPLKDEDLRKALDTYFSLRRDRYPVMLRIRTENERGKEIAPKETYPVQPREIVYIEGYNKYAKIHLKDKRVLVCIHTMKAVLAMLPKDDFCRVGKGYAVNLMHISNRNREYIYFKNGESVPISRFYYKSFISEYMRYSMAEMPY
jgi:DNA-binding LytR/AlgR family response regulator